MAACALDDGSDFDDEISDEGVHEVWDSDDEAILETKPALEWWQVTFNLVVVVIGAGVMALPNLPNKGGFFPSIIFLGICGLSIMEGGIAMWKGTMAANKNAEKGEMVVSYEDFGRAAYGVAGESAVVITQIFYFIGVAASFLVLISESLSHLTHGHLSQQNCMFIITPVMALISLLPNVTAISQFVPLAVLGIVILCAVIIVKSIADAQRWQDWTIDQEKLHLMWTGDFLNLGIVVASLYGAFGVNGNVPSVLGEMKDPMMFPMAYRLAMVIVAVLYSLVMCCGYYGYGTFIQSDIVLSLTSFPGSYQEAFHTAFDDWTGPKALVLRDIISSCLFVKLVIGLPLNLMVIYYSFQTFRYTKNIFPPSTCVNKVMRISIVALGFVIALAIPDFGKLFALVCSIFGPLMQTVYPIWFSYVIRTSRGSTMTRSCRRVFHVLILLLSLFTITVGFYSALEDVIKG